MIMGTVVPEIGVIIKGYVKKIFTKCVKTPDYHLFCFVHSWHDFRTAVIEGTTIVLED